jgi:Flp pilus assembly protein TadG
MDNLLLVLGQLLGDALSGNRSKSKFMWWVDRGVIAVLVTLIAIVLFRIFLK